jgi:hypothetical protein
VCRGSRGEYGASAAAARRCFSHERAIDKQPIDKAHRFPTYVCPAHAATSVRFCGEDVWLFETRSCYVSKNASCRIPTKRAFEIAELERFWASLVIRATRVSTAESLGTFPPLWSRCWLSAQRSTCRHERGLTFLLELCARLIRRIRMLASVF